LRFAKSLFIKDYQKKNTATFFCFAILDGFMKLLLDIGKAYEALAMYDCRKAIELFESLPLHQLSTSWTMEKLAISYYECGNNELVRCSCLCIFA